MSRVQFSALKWANRGQLHRCLDNAKIIYPLLGDKENKYIFVHLTSLLADPKLTIYQLYF